MFFNLLNYIEIGLPIGRCIVISYINYAIELDGKA